MCADASVFYEPAGYVTESAARRPDASRAPTRPRPSGRGEDVAVRVHIHVLLLLGASVPGGAARPRPLLEASPADGLWEADAAAELSAGAAGFGGKSPKYQKLSP